MSAARRDFSDFDARIVVEDALRSAYVDGWHNRNRPSQRDLAVDPTDIERAWAIGRDEAKANV